MAENIHNKDAMRKVDEVAMDTSSTLTRTEMFVELALNKLESPRDLHLVPEYPSKPTRGAVREKPKVLPKPKLRAPQIIDPPQGNSSEDVRTPNNKPTILPKPSLNVTKETAPQRDTSREHSGSPKERPLVLPKPRLNVSQMNKDPSNDILPVCYKTTKEKPKVSPKPRLNASRNMDQPNDMSTGDVVTPKDIDQSKDGCTRDVATPKEIKEVDQPKNHSTGDVATPKENAESLAEPNTKNLKQTKQPIAGKHEGDAAMPRGKPILSPKPTLNAPKEIYQPNGNFLGNVVTLQDTPKVLSTQDTLKVVSTQDTPKVRFTQDKPKVLSTQDTPKVTSKQDSPKVLSKQDSPKVLSKQDSPKVLSKQDSPKVLSAHDSSKVLSTQDLPKGLSKQSLNEVDQPNDNGPHVVTPEGTYNSPPKSNVKDLEQKDTLPGDAGAPKEGTKISPEPDLKVSQVADRTRFVFPGNTGTYKGKRIFSSPSSVYDEQIYRSQMRRQNKQIENSRRAKRLEEERLAHKKREEEYREMIEEENITKKMQEWISRRSRAIKQEEESFHKKMGTGELHTTMRKLGSKLLNLQEHREMEMVEEVLKQKLIRKENQRKESLEGERMVITKQDENISSVMLEEGSRKMRELDDNGQRAESSQDEKERRQLQTDVRSIYREKRVDRIRKMKESGENDWKWIESQKRDEEIQREKNRNGVRFLVNREKGEKQTLQELDDTRASGSLTNIEQTGGSKREGRIRLKKMEELSRKIKELQESDKSEVTFQQDGNYLDSQRLDEARTIEDTDDGEDGFEGEECWKEESDKEGEMALHTAEMKSSPYSMTETTKSSTNRTETTMPRTYYFLISGVVLLAAIVFAVASVAVYYECL